MDNSKSSKRKNFKCIFNGYVSEYNRDAVIRSVIAQFEGYFAEPEVTVTDSGFIISLLIGDNLSPTAVRDKILWNQFIESVSIADEIRKIQIIRLPKASKENEGTVGAWGPHGSNSGVDEIMVANGKPIPHMEYKIDMGDRPDGPMTFNSSLHYADPTEDIIPTIYGPGAENGEPVDEDLKSDVTDVTSQPARNHAKLFMGFKVVAVDSDTGGSFTLTTPNGFQDVEEPPRGGARHERANSATGIGGGADISGASWYVTQPGNEQGTQPGAERLKDDGSTAPFGSIVANSIISPTLKAEDDTQSIEGPYGDTLDVLGVGDHPMGGATYGSIFGMNETYDYEGDVDGYDI